MPFPLLLYRFSGWLITAICIYLAYKAIRSSKIWQGKYVYMGVAFLWIAVCITFSSITALILKNNLFVDYFYIPILFVLKGLFIIELHKNVAIRWTIVLIIVLFIFISFWNAFQKNAMLNFNTLGSILNTSFFLVGSLYTLTLLFKDKKPSSKLRNNPDFWFVSTIFCFAFLGFVSSIITDVSYKAGNNDNVLYAIFITENFIFCVLYLGYFKGLKLLNS